MATLTGKQAGKVIDLEPLVEPRPLLLLEVLGTITIPATTAPFVAANHFVVNRVADAPVRIAYVSDNFKAWYGQKTEAPTTASTLRSVQLTRPARDAPILAELKEHADTTLAAIRWLLERQPHGEDGTLLNNGQVNVFYVPDVNGVRRAVFVYWLGDGWDVYADSVGHLHVWSVSYRIFSRSPR